MKIYNEIITQFNDTTGQWDTLYEESEEYNGPMMFCALANWMQTINLGVNSGVTCDPSGGDVWVQGNEKAARQIHKETLDIDFTLTSLRFLCTSAAALNGSSPGVIRVYQQGYESSAATLDVSSTTFFEVAFEIDIKGVLGPRIVVVDGWDPLSGDPNNLCSFGGILSLYGKPLISSQGATQ